MSGVDADRRFLAGIQNRLIIAFLTVTMIPVVVLAIYGTQSHLRALNKLAFDNAAEEATRRADKLQEALDDAQGDLLYLTVIPSLDTYIEAAARPDVENLDYLRDKLAKQFETFVGNRRRYRAAAYIDSAGREVVRVQFTGATTRVVPFGDLGSRPLQSDLPARGEELLAGQTLTLVERGESGAVVHFVARLFPRGLQRRGFVVLEIALSTLWEDDKSAGSDTRIVLLDEAGEALVGDAGDISPQVLSVVSKSPRHPTEIEEGRIATFVPIHPDQINPTQQWSFVMIGRRAHVFSAVTRYRQVFTVVLLLTLVAAGAISVLLARQFTVPLRRLYSAAQEIGHGQFDVPIDDQTGDEIGGLARELRAMADKLRIKHEDMQHQIDEKTRELLQAERLSTIGTMSAAIAHEVNNPIGIISLYSQMLLEQVGPDDPRAVKLQTIVGEASRISVLVRGLLQFARRPELNVTSIELGALIDQAIAASASLQENMDKIELRREVDEDCPRIEGDADQLGQVLRNLTLNAFHALSGGGTVTLSAGRADDDHVRICVRDTGHGIDPEHLANLFEPFFTTKRFGAGTGLGLSISKEIVQRHGGDISVTSEVGQGTTFTILLPIRGAGSSDRQDDSGTTDA